MPADSSDQPSGTGEILRQLSAQLDAVETELKRLGWWSDNPPDLLAEVAAGRLKSYLDAPTFELWLQGVFLPNARSRVAENDLPKTSSVGEMAHRQYDFHSFVPEAQPLLKLLQEFDDLVEHYPQPPAPEPPESVVNPVPPEMAEMFATSRGLLLQWLDLAEDQLRRRDWWDDGPDKPAVAFGRWMRDSFLRATRASIRTGVVPTACDLSGEAARRLATDGLTVPEEMTPILTNFDEGVSTYHSTWQLCGLPPAVPMADTPIIPPAYTGEFGRERPEPAARNRLAFAPPEAMGFEVILEETRGLLDCVLDCIETALDELPEELPAPAGDEQPVEEWLAEEFLPDVREWLKRGQVPQESQVAVSAEQEFAARGVRAPVLLESLRSFDVRVTAYHQLSLTLPQESAGARIAAAWRLVMATPGLRTPVAPEPDAVRLQMLLLLNRIEAELHLLGWWCAVPPVLPGPFKDTIKYSRWQEDGVDPPRFETWLLSSWLPQMRERVQIPDIPEASTVHNEAIIVMSEERLGRERYEESRRLHNALDEMETLMLQAWPAALLRHKDSRRRRGLTPPSQKPSAELGREAAEFREYVAEALRLAAYELKRLGWWGCDAAALRALLADPGALELSGPPPFEHWLEAVFIPETQARLKDGRLLEEHRVSDYVAWECRHSGQLAAAKDLLTQLERVDHWSSLANRTQRESWEV